MIHACSSSLIACKFVCMRISGIFLGLQLSFFWRRGIGGVGGQAAPTFANILMGAVETNVKILICFKKSINLHKNFIMFFFW